MSYASTVPTIEIAAGVIGGATALTLMIIQSTKNHALQFMDDAAWLVLATTVACMVFTFFEARISWLGGSKPLYSGILVIAPGLVATFAQTALLAVAAANELTYWLAASVQLAQLVANAIMLAIIFARIPGGAYRQLAV